MSHVNLNIGDWIETSAERDPDRECFVCLDQDARPTFAEAAVEVTRIASGLAEEWGVGPGDRVAVWATDCHFYAELFLACAKLGATIVPLNYRLQPHEIAEFVRRSHACALVVSEQYLDAARQLVSESSIAVDLLTMTESDGPERAISALAARPGNVDTTHVENDAIFSLCFTSGTTGRSKGVRQPQGMIKSMIAQFAIEYNVGDPREEFRYSASPMFHVAGIAIVLLGIARGFPMLIQKQFEPTRTRHWMSEGGLSGAFLVPTMLRMILDLPGTREQEYAGLHTILYGSAPMSPTLLRESMEVFGCDFVNVFGAGTEAGLQTVLTPEDHRRATDKPELLSSIGRPAYGVRLRIVDPALNDVQPGTIGEIATRSETLMDGYEGADEETAEAFRGGWFRAGDLAHQDEDGYVYLAGRSTEMIIRGGENIYPVEVESIIVEHEAISQAAVVGRPDRTWGERVVAFVTTTRDLDHSEIIAHCRSRMAKYKVPDEFVIVEDLPRNASGKVLKRELAETFTDSGDTAR